MVSSYQLAETCMKILTLYQMITNLQGQEYFLREYEMLSMERNHKDKSLNLNIIIRVGLPHEPLVIIFEDKSHLFIRYLAPTSHNFRG